MGILNLLFGKKKVNVTSSSQAVKSAISTSKPEVRKNEESIVEPFIFESNQHQRFESDHPVQGLQKCPRTIKVEKNTSGCSGYEINPGDGYIVRMINGDTGKEQMSAKPMRVINTTTAEFEFRGYKVNAMTPFGFQEVDLSDYGLTVVLNNGKVMKCALHMYDRDMYIEYRK